MVIVLRLESGDWLSWREGAEYLILLSPPDNLGQTSSGKTYTMTGVLDDPEQQGQTVVVMAMKLKS